MGYSTKRKRGRPKVERSAHDYGNAYVQARADRFRPFGGDASKGHEFTCAGRLMLVGAFDGLEQEPAAYLSALIEYANGYWGHFGGGAKVSEFERYSRAYQAGNEFTPDRHGEWFDSLDSRLRDAGHQARSAVHAVSVDRHWFPDEDVSWAARIINRRFRDKGLSVCGELACDSDWAMLDLLKLGVSALVGQSMRRAA